MSSKLIFVTEVQTRSQQNRWNLDRVLPSDYNIPARYIAGVPRQVYSNFCQLLSRDVYSESDSQALYDCIVIRSDRMSPEFLLMLDLWLADELKHYEALRRTYHCIAGVDFSEMNRQFSQRVHEIQPIELLLTDEFR